MGLLPTNAPLTGELLCIFNSYPISIWLIKINSVSKALSVFMLHLNNEANFIIKSTLENYPHMLLFHMLQLY